MRRQLLFVGVLLLFGLLSLVGPAYGQTFKVGSFLKPAASGTQVVPHGLGETPKALILWTNGKTNESFGADFNFGFGVTDEFLNRYSTSIASSDALATTQARRSMYSMSIDIVTVGGLNYAQAYVTSWDSTNFTLQWTIANATQCVIHFIAIGGSGVSSKVVNWQMPTATGNRSVTGVGFKPDLVIHVHAGYDFTSLPARTANANFGLGVMDSAGNQWATSALSIHAAAAADTQRGQQTDACMYAFNNSFAVQKEASFVSMDADGFTVNFTNTTSAAASQVFSLALKGIKANAGYFSKTTGAGPINQSATGVGFQPSVVLLSSFQNTTQANPVANTRLGLGASDGSTQGSSAFTDTDTLDPTQVDGIDKTSKVFMKVDNNTPSITAEADLATMDSNGFTLRWTTNDAVATEMLYLALGQVSSQAGDGPLIAYSQNASYVNDRLYYSLYQYGRWTSGAYAVKDPSGDYDQYYKVARTNPALTKQAVVWKNSNPGDRRYLLASIWDGDKWDDGTGSPYGDVKNFGLTWPSTATQHYRGFDAAFEQLSGDLLVVSAINVTNTLWYWTWNGSTWSGQGTATIPSNNWTYRWCRLAPRPSSDEIAFIGSSDGGGVFAARWTGSAWTSTTTCVTTGGNYDTDAIDIQYVQAGTYANDIVAVWGQGQYVYRKIYRNNLGSWDASTQVADLGSGNTVMWLKLKPKSTGDDLILAIGATVSGTYRVYTIPYDGDTRTWGSLSSAHNPSTAAYGNSSYNRPFDVIWDPGSGGDNVLLVYSDTSGLRYKTSSDRGTTWGSQQSVTTSYQAYWVQLERMIDDTIHLAIHDNSDDLNTWTWASSTWTFKNEITTDLETGYNTNREVEVFALSGFTRKPDKFEFRRPITINISQRDSSCTGSLSNFPVLINLSGDWLKTTANGGRIYSSNGYDIVFRGSDGVTPLAHEIEGYDGSATGGTLVAWVRVPELFENNQDTIIYIDYGSSSVTSTTESPTSVWDSNYVGVWHLKEDPSGTAPQMKDSTTPSEDGTSSGSMISGDQVPGFIDGSLNFDGSNDLITTGAAAGSPSAITVSAWVKHDTLPNTIQRYVTVNSEVAAIRHDGSISVGQLHFYIKTSGTLRDLRVNGALAIGAWYYVVGTWDGTTQNLYQNGSLVATQVPGGTLNATTTTWISSAAEAMDGLIDEVRISNTARDACWIGTEYNNQNGPGSFTTVGDEIMLGKFENRNQITINVSQRGSSCTGSLSNFPVLINLSGDWLKTKADGGSLYSSNGYDIIFRDSNNNQLDHEIEKYDVGGSLVSKIWQVSVDNRDAHDDTVTGHLDRIYISNSLWNDSGGFQWAVTIPQGATIISARIRLYSTWHTGATDAYTARIRVEDVDNASVFTGAANNIRTRSYWGTTVDWAIPTNGLPINTWSYSPDISSLIQHVVNRSGWSSGNNLSIAIWGQTSGGVSGCSEEIIDYTDDPSRAARLEVTYLDRSGANLVAWVRIPTLFENNQDTVIYMYYGNAAITSPTANPTGVWDTNYKGVWHLKEATGNTVGDSTATPNNGTPQGFPVQVVGKIDGSLNFNSASSQYVQVPNNTDLQLSTNMTVSVWVNTTSVDYQSRLIVAKWLGGGNRNYWLGKFWPGATTLQLSFAVNAGAANVTIPWSINDGAWHYVVGVADAANSLLRLYVDGAQQATVGYGGTSETGTSELDIGKSPDDALQLWNDRIDEVRISNVARDACWIQTEYNNYNSASTFSTVGTGEEFAYKYRKQITLLDSMTPVGCTSDLANFPVLINLSGDWLKTEENGGNINHPYGYDIIFKAQDGETKLDHEIEKYDGGGISFIRSGGVSNGASFSFDIGTPGTNRLVVVTAGVEVSGTNLSGVTVDGKACHHIATAENTSNGYNHQEMWYCDEDDLGSSSGAVTVAIQGGSTNWGVHAHLYTRVDQSGPVDFGIDNTSINTTTVTVNGIDVPANGLVVMGAGENMEEEDALTVSSWTSPLVQRQSQPGHPFSADLMSASGIETSAQTNKTYTATFSKTFTRGTGIVASFAPATGGSETGKLVAWVRIPTLLRNANTLIYMYYGNPGVTSPTANPTGVWDSSYKGVWHLQETSGSYLDSTGNNNAGTPTVTSRTATAKIGTNAPQFDSATNNNINCGTGSSLDFSGNMTLEAWIYPTGWGEGGFGGIIERGAGSDVGYEFYIRQPSTSLAIYDGTSLAGNVGSITLNTWQHVVAVVTGGSNASFYVNGVGAGSGSWTFAPGGSATFYMGSFSDMTDTFAGTIDEVRVSNVARSACWIGTESNNQSLSSPGTYYTVEGEEELTFNHRKQITLLNSMTPANCSSNLSNFPVHISLSGNWLKTVGNGGEIYRTEGYDIIFRAQDGVTKLDHEIEKYDGTAGTLVAWVRIPNLSYNANTIIYMYYGNSTINTSQANPTGVWDTSFGWRAVWHLKEDPSGGAPQIKDSTSYGNHGTAGGSWPTGDQVAGKIDGSLDFDAGDYISMGDPASLDMDTSDFTIETWVRLDPSATQDGETIVWKGAGSTSNPGYWLFWYNLNNFLRFTISNGDGVTQRPAVDSTISIDDGLWHHVVAVADRGGNGMLYIDGQFEQLR